MKLKLWKIHEKSSIDEENFDEKFLNKNKIIFMSKSCKQFY